MKILVVDDDFFGREILLTFLEEYGTCNSACDGGEALDKFYEARTAGMPYDLICLDIQMPVRDGNQVLAEIRKAEADGGHKSCIFIITAHESPELINNIEGADDFISKPCSANLIKRLFERHHLLNSVVSEKHNVLVVSGDPATRTAMMHALKNENIASFECASFIEAERAALINSFSAVVADVPTIVKAKNDERLAVFSLQNIYPLIRVKVSGNTVLPIILRPEEHGQSIVTYLQKSCAAFVPRRLRAHKRHKIFVPVLIIKNDGQQYQTFTLDISWGGAFTVMNRPWGLVPGNTLLVHMPTLDISIMAEIIRIQDWGKQGLAPGLSLAWKSPLEKINLEGLKKVLRTDITNDYDRLLG